MELTPEIADKVDDLMRRKGLKAVLEYLDSMNIRHKAVKQHRTMIDPLWGVAVKSFDPGQYRTRRADDGPRWLGVKLKST